MSMQEKRFLRPTKHKLLYANIVIYGAVIVLVLLFHRDLIWAGRSSRFYLSSGSLDISKDNLLTEEAMGHIRSGDVATGQRLLIESLQINPYARTKLLLGISYLRQGDENKMLECFDEYRKIEPSFIGSYIQMINILEKKQDFTAINQLLTDGIEHFRRQISLYQPHYDPNAPKPANLKSVNVYNELQKSLKLLEKTQQRFNNR